MSGFGWTYLSRNALRRAERQLANSGEGVRDEIGFLIIHQRYADYFFPGTSVLHTRLRYALFVPWIYQTLHAEGGSGPVTDRLQREEIKLAGRLKYAKGGGAIGGDNFPDPISQPPSVSYWTALGTWGVLRQVDEHLPSRAQLNAMLQSKYRKAVDDDGLALARTELPFTALPKPPKDWNEDGPLTFDLPTREAEFLRGLLLDLRPKSAPERLSLLAKLATGERVEANNCWDPGIVELAKEDGPKLRRAGYAASLAAVGRAVYAALVEMLQEDDGQSPTAIHRKLLPKVIEEHAARARRVNMLDLIQDTGSLPDAVVQVLEKTIAWLAAGAKNAMVLRDVYEHAEYDRKGRRARLSRLTGAERRIEWRNSEHAAATPLHFRWSQVRRLLRDLWDAA